MAEASARRNRPDPTHHENQPDRLGSPQQSGLHLGLVSSAMSSYSSASKKPDGGRLGDLDCSVIRTIEHPQRGPSVPGFPADEPQYYYAGSERRLPRAQDLSMVFPRPIQGTEVLAPQPVQGPRPAPRSAGFADRWCTSIQLWLADGTRMSARFHVHHMVDGIRAFTGCRRGLYLNR